MEVIGSFGVSWAKIAAAVLLTTQLFTAGRCKPVMPIQESFSLSNITCLTTIFNFGDSLSDTGNALFAFPYYTDPENPPYGQTFFGQPSKRFCDGRLVPDFLAQAFHLPFLQGYFETPACNYKHGVNYAFAGATGSNDTTVVPFFLAFQIGQHRRFRRQADASARTLPVACGGNAPEQYLPASYDYSNALYMISIGGNDFLHQYAKGNFNITDIITTVVPRTVEAVENAVRALHEEQARHFLIFNVPPQGCSPIVLTNLAGLGFPLNAIGCVEAGNLVPEGYNTLLFLTVQRLRLSLLDSTIMFFDYYNANIEILKHPEQYGFLPNATTIACCGSGGAYNYNRDVPCGRTGLINGMLTSARACVDPSQYVNWDGVHFTESFYRTISSFILTGRFVDPPIDYSSVCNVDLSQLGLNRSKTPS